ncbi:hypothetical protein J8366_23020 [Escherichia coli]|nr:hypothetical protein [Escherichia coli]
MYKTTKWIVATFCLAVLVFGCEVENVIQNNLTIDGFIFYATLMAENIREIFLTNLGSTNPTIQDQVMFGYGDIPYLFGYSEGYKMISSYLKMNPNQSIKAWTSLTPDEIYTSLKSRFITITRARH